MKTECPNCGTIFNIAPLQMTRTDKRVRCSACMTVFNSDICLVIDSNQPHKKSRPETPPFLQKTNTPPPNTKNKEHSTEQLGETKNYYPVPVENKNNDEDEIPEFLRNYEETKKHRNIFGSLFSVAIGISLIFVLCSQSIDLFKDTLSSDHKLRPYVQLFCQYTNCKLEPLRSVQSFKLIKRNIYSHPNQKGELIISAVFKNDAPFSQAYPKIRISMSDIQGNLVAQRIFSAGEYLTIPNQQMLKGSTATLSLNIIDPGHNALTFELEFI